MYKKLNVPFMGDAVVHVQKWKKFIRLPKIIVYQILSFFQSVRLHRSQKSRTPSLSEDFARYSHTTTKTRHKFSCLF